jgi:hypothetical protein
MYRIFRKRLVLAALVPAVYLSLLLFLCSISAVSAQGRIDRFVANGDSAEASWSDGRIQGYVSVSSGGNVQNPETFLQYIIVEFSPCCTTLEAGSGLIPANDFKGSGTTSLNLNTNTSAGSNPGFTRYFGFGGVITVNWQKTSVLVTRVTGTTQTRFGNLLFTSHGEYEDSSASAQGSAMGALLTGDVFGSLRKDHQLNITIQQGP